MSARFFDLHGATRPHKIGLGRNRHFRDDTVSIFSISTVETLCHDDEEHTVH
jgi:hypothetical protein